MPRRPRKRRIVLTVSAELYELYRERCEELEVGPCVLGGRVLEWWMKGPALSVPEQPEQAGEAA